MGSEGLTLVTTSSFSDKTSATDKTVSDSVGLEDGSDGGLASNYQLRGSGAISTIADITPKTLTVSGVTAANKTYDGLTLATLSGWRARWPGRC